MDNFKVYSPAHGNPCFRKLEKTSQLLTDVANPHPCRSGYSVQKLNPADYGYSSQQEKEATNSLRPLDDFSISHSLPTESRMASIGPLKQDTASNNTEKARANYSPSVKGKAKARHSPNEKEATEARVKYIKFGRGRKSREIKKSKMKACKSALIMGRRPDLRNYYQPPISHTATKLEAFVLATLKSHID